MKHWLSVLRSILSLRTQLAVGLTRLSHSTSHRAMLILAAVSSSSLVSAYTVPSAGDFGYDFYDILITKGTSGPLGFVGAGILGLVAVATLRTQWVVSIGCVLGAAAIVKLDDILVTLGAVV